MTIINSASREICAKVVYYGPGLSGKTTTLKRVYESIRPTHRGEMVSLATEGDRTLFFDFLPVRVERVGHAGVRLALYTVPGQVFYNATRRLVLHGADGVVFVADSHPDAFDNNIESMENLQQNLQESGLSIEQIPVVIQYNKRDLPEALPVEELRRALNKLRVPDFETIASQGKGVLETLRCITRAVIKSIKAKGVGAARPQRKPEALDSQAGPSLGSQIEAAASSAPLPDPSLMTALVPDSAASDAALVEADYRAGCYKEAVARSFALLRSLLSSLGPPEASEVELALMAGLTGPDFARLLRMEKQSQPSRDAAAFAMLMVGLAGVRLRR
jgi:signal recognition particle receptor subunit beta